MRTMASAWFLVTVLITINEVYGDIYSMDRTIMNCNECIRSGYHWCNKPGSVHCRVKDDDDWCTGDKELLPRIPEVNVNLTGIIPMYAERSLAIGVPNRLDIHYDAPGLSKPLIIIANTTQTRNIQIVDLKTSCEENQCVTQIEATANRSFCDAWGDIFELVYVKVFVGKYPEPVVVKYHVPCACECSLPKNVQKNSPVCDGQGDLVCGRCQCHPGRKGENCLTPNCPEKRGDVQCMDASRMDVNCFGNGYCGPCDTCICYTDREGSQYFDVDNYCADLCTLTSDCDGCLHNNTIGECDGCIHAMKIIPHNETDANERDGYNRKLWMKCNLTVLDCHIDYLAMRNEEDLISVMITNSCQDKISGAVGPGVLAAAPSKVPLILGVLAVLLAIAAVAGVMIWKYMNAVPPAPLNDSQYQNIDAEDCQYQNPLYVSPTTSFKNPMFGKPQ